MIQHYGNSASRLWLTENRAHDQRSRKTILVEMT